MHKRIICIVPHQYPNSLTKGPHVPYISSSSILFRCPSITSLDPSPIVPYPSLHPRAVLSIIRIHPIMLPMQYLFQSALMMYRIARRIILPRLPLLRLLIVLHLGQVWQLPLLGQVCLHLGGAVLRGYGGLCDRLRGGCGERRSVRA